MIPTGLRHLLVYAALSGLMLLAAVAVRAGGWERIAGDESGIRSQRTAVVGSEREWLSLWKEHAAGLASGGPPAVDFKKEMVVAVFLGERATGGYAVSLSLQPDPLDPSVLVVFWRELAPKPGAMVVDMLTSPFEMRKIPKAFASVTFALDARMRAMPAAPGRMVRGQAPRNRLPHSAAPSAGVLFAEAAGRVEKALRGAAETGRSWSQPPEVLAR